MPDRSDDLHREAQEDRDHAQEIAEDNPTAAEYCERRANWKDYLARQQQDEE